MRVGPYHHMLAALVGDLGAVQLWHERRAFSDLCTALDPDAPVVTIETQEAAAAFLWEHGTRTTRRYARALMRQGSL